jgi:pimeloyl-ACP methyl ester carboxylesterase
VPSLRLLKNLKMRLGKASSSFLATLNLFFFHIMANDIRVQADPRFTYSYRIVNTSGSASEPLQLLVAVHGNGRDDKSLLQTYVQHANNLPPGHYVMLFPLFPVGVLGDNSDKGYKYIREKSIRYDTLLLDMIDQLSRHDLRLQRSFSTFLLHGYSGGGQFAHRFFYLHPEKIRALFVGAPGTVTFLDDNHDWWPGTRDIKAKFETPACLDMDAMRRVPALLAVGDRDTEKLLLPKGTMDRLAASYGGHDKLVAAFGHHRLERLENLYKNWKMAGMNVNLQIIPGMGHNGIGAVPHAIQFFASVI